MNGYNFTERVRKVLAMAREEAARLRHEYVGTEHILLGLLHEGEGVGIAVLQNLGVDIGHLRDLIETTIKVGKDATTVGRDVPYTSRAKKVLEFAMAEAREMNHSYVGTEHLLLGLLREEKGIAALVLNTRGVTLDSARVEVVHLLGTEAVRVPGDTTKPAAPSFLAATERQNSFKPLSYAVEIEYEGGTTVRRRFASKAELLQHVMAL